MPVAKVESTEEKTATTPPPTWIQKVVSRVTYALLLPFCPFCALLFFFRACVLLLPACAAEVFARQSAQGHLQSASGSCRIPPSCTARPGTNREKVKPDEMFSLNAKVAFLFVGTSPLLAVPGFFLFFLRSAAAAAAPAAYYYVCFELFSV